MKANDLAPGFYYWGNDRLTGRWMIFQFSEGRLYWAGDEVGAKPEEFVEWTFYPVPPANGTAE